MVDADAQLRKARTDKKVRAILHETYPVRYWDHDLGPAQTHILTLDLAEGQTEDHAEDATALPRLTDRTPAPGRSLDHVAGALTPDGSVLLAAVGVREARGDRSTLVTIDCTSGHRSVLFDNADVDHEMPALSHDGRTIAWVRTVRSTPPARTSKRSGPPASTGRTRTASPPTGTAGRANSCSSTATAHCSPWPTRTAGHPCSASRSTAQPSNS
ncbi:hypothetical protein QP157_16450 [Sphingomonas sp. LR61]|uniref:hypothetical protein n=1 Tax=Sphingomonas sp. LR61 TaxID=3050234 RepID=UPI002FE2E01B